MATAVQKGGYLGRVGLEGITTEAGFAPVRQVINEWCDGNSGDFTFATLVPTDGVVMSQNADNVSPLNNGKNILIYGNLVAGGSPITCEIEIMFGIFTAPTTYTFFRSGIKQNVSLTANETKPFALNFLAVPERIKIRIATVGTLANTTRLSYALHH